MRLNESECKEKNNIILKYPEKSNLNPDTVSIIFFSPPLKKIDWLIDWFEQVGEGTEGEDLKQIPH